MCELMGGREPSGSPEGHRLRGEKNCGRTIAELYCFGHFCLLSFLRRKVKNNEISAWSHVHAHPAFLCLQKKLPPCFVPSHRWRRLQFSRRSARIRMFCSRRIGDAKRMLYQVLFPQETYLELDFKLFVNPKLTCIPGYAKPKKENKKAGQVLTCCRGSFSLCFLSYATSRLRSGVAFSGCT